MRKEMKVKPNQSLERRPKKYSKRRFLETELHFPCPVFSNRHRKGESNQEHGSWQRITTRNIGLSDSDAERNEYENKTPEGPLLVGFSPFSSSSC